MPRLTHFLGMFILFLVSLCWHSMSFAESQTSKVEPKTLTVAFPTNIEPWVITDKQGGFLVDVVAEALEGAGWKLKSEFLPLQRMRLAFDNPKIDAIGWGDAGFANAEHRSKPIASLQAVFVLPETKQKKLKDKDDLKEVSIAAFQGAKTIWPYIDKISKENRSYLELADQKGQVAMLLEKRVDALLIEQQIFRWWANKNHWNPSTQPMVYRNIGALLEGKPQVDKLAVIFKDAKVRDAFNESLVKMVESGRLGQLAEKYGIEP